MSGLRAPPTCDKAGQIQHTDGWLKDTTRLRITRLRRIDAMVGAKAFTEVHPTSRLALAGIPVFSSEKHSLLTNVLALG
jgi:hypothetical protein